MGTGERSGGHGDMRGIAFERIFMHVSALGRAHLGQKKMDRSEEKGTGGHQGEDIWAQFNASGAFGTERWGQERGEGNMGDRVTGGARTFGCILMLSGAFLTERGGQEGG